MSKREPTFNVDPETGEMVEIDEELSAAIDEAVASSLEFAAPPVEPTPTASIASAKRLRRDHLPRGGRRFPIDPVVIMVNSCGSVSA